MALYNISTYSQYTEVLIGFMLCHTTLNLPPNCSNRAFFIRLPPSLVPGVRRKKARWSDCIFDPFEVSDFFETDDYSHTIRQFDTLAKWNSDCCNKCTSNEIQIDCAKMTKTAPANRGFFLLWFETEHCYNALWKITHFENFFQVRKIRRLVKALNSPILSFIRK